MQTSKVPEKTKSILDLVTECKDSQLVDNEAITSRKFLKRRFLKLTFANLSSRSTLLCKADYFNKGEFFNQPGFEFNRVF